MLTALVLTYALARAFGGYLPLIYKCSATLKAALLPSKENFIRLGLSANAEKHIKNADDYVVDFQHTSNKFVTCSKPSLQRFQNLVPNDYSGIAVPLHRNRGNR